MGEHDVLDAVSANGASAPVDTEDSLSSIRARRRANEEHAIELEKWHKQELRKELNGLHQVGEVRNITTLREIRRIRVVGDAFVKVECEKKCVVGAVLSFSPEIQQRRGLSLTMMAGSTTTPVLVVQAGMAKGDAS
jgi:hypothetical protein